MRKVNEWNEYNGLACIQRTVSFKDNSSSRLCQRSLLRDERMFGVEDGGGMVPLKCGEGEVNEF